MKYQYKAVKTTSSVAVSDVETWLNTQGAKGWELVCFFVQGTNYVAILKRAIVR